MVLLDGFLEPVDMRYDFWTWQGKPVPFSNFISWFWVASLLRLYFQRASIYKYNRLTCYVPGAASHFYRAVQPAVSAKLLLAKQHRIIFEESVGYKL